MPTIIDSLFLELGIDTSKFSDDQKRALGKIAEFEKKAKSSAKKSTQAVKTVGAAFRDIADESAIGKSARGLDLFATKLKALGAAGKVTGGAGGVLGGVAEGLGALLSPTTLALAAVTLLGKGVWDFDKRMTAANATIYRQSQLSGMNAKNLWAWSEAAKTVGANPQDIAGGIASLQTAVGGMGIGAGNATGQLVALSRLGGIGWNFRSGVNITQLFERVHQLAAQGGFQNLGALRALTGPLMNDAMFALATNPNFDPAHLQAKIRGMEPKDFGKILADAVASQQKLGLMQVSKDTLMQRVYGATQNVFDTIAVGVQQLVGLVQNIWDFISRGVRAVEHAGQAVAGAHHAANDIYAGGIMALYGPRGVRNNNPGNLKYAGQPGAIGKDADGFAIFGSWGAGLEAMRRQLRLDQSRGLNSISQIVNSWAPRLGGNNTAAYIAAVAKAMHVLPNAHLDLSNPAMMSALMTAMVNQEDGQGVMQAMRAMHAASNSRTHVVHHNATHHTVINGGISVHTQATDAKGVVTGMRGALSTHPLIGPVAQHQVTLSTSAVGG